MAAFTPQEEFPDLDFPQDKNGFPANVLFGLTEMTPGRNGKFIPIAVDPATGQLVVQLGGGSASGAEFSHADDTPALALVDLMRRLVVIPNISTPNFALMHDHVTSANVETIIPVAPKGYGGALGSAKLIMDVDIQTVGGYVTLLPIVWNPLLDKYIPGIASKRITSSQRIYLSIESPEDIYLMPIEVNGTVSIAVAGV